ncbi:sn-glycerol-3-phosphate import ATP-binding protein UgpC [Lentilactobacillus sunkii]|uniref:sn-glycerol-3-phosphate import ATP-binding protein UgpC n=1 Tax=Lentilactobacillus sunkii TaxID=481719 RepID=A0A1E7XJ92_9LACO|nr:ABC transporter ATP-binding protein [Lentilactobacillus sunkii]OFA13166.1 sn-glycerol-3-phosphate import ATP-binding protein UgpC [Lentilactobacillus sunkii]
MSITLRNVRKDYDAQTEVLKDISVKVETGEFFVIVGPSGCGKSTLLRMIAGLTPITAGEVSIDDKVVNDLAAKARKLTMVFQNYALFPFMNVWDNVAFGLKARKMDQADIKQRVDEALKMVNLTELAKRKPRELSGGQRQRVALARAVASDAKICLMDEPLSNLDAQLRIKMRQEIYALQRKLGLTLIYVTHDQVEAMTMADHIMVLNDKHVQQIGTPSEIYQNPANDFVAKFFGTPQINILNAKRSQTDNHVLDVDSDLEIALDEEVPAENVKIGIRPDDMKVEAAESVEANATVKNIEFLGDETIIYATLNSGEDIHVVVPGQVNYRIFQPIKVTADSNLMFFDADGNRMNLSKEAYVHA